MNVAIIDADLLGRKNHRFPNLVCMKLSSYFKSQGNNARIVYNGSQMVQSNIILQKEIS